MTSKKNAFSAEAIILKTNRLVMTIPTLTDFEEMFLLWSDPLVVANVTGQPLNREEVWARLHRIVGHWSLLGYGHWIIRERETGAFAGEVGFFDFKRGLGEAFDSLYEIGWMLAVTAQGKGYATEAVTAALDWLEERFEHGGTFCLVDPSNRASLNLAKKFSYEVERETTYRGRLMWVLRRETSCRLSRRLQV